VGAWGAGTFENDDVMDWVAELNALAPADLEKILAHSADEPGYLESSAASVALGAAEVAAALNGSPLPSAPKEIEQWVKKHPQALTPDLKKLALRAVDRVRRNSELKDLWMEADGLTDWIELLKDLQARLGG